MRYSKSQLAGSGKYCSRHAGLGAVVDKPLDGYGPTHMLERCLDYALPER